MFEPRQAMLTPACRSPQNQPSQGDLAKAAYAQVAPSLRQSLEACGAALAPAGASTAVVANNACWAAGEVAVRTPAAALEPFIVPLAQAVVPLLSARLGDRHLVHNAAITLGRIAAAHPDPLVPHLGSFVREWCAALRSIRDDVEKEHAFAGLCALVRRNPGAAAPHFAPLCLACSSWMRLHNEGLHRDMVSILAGYKEHFVGQGGTAWADAARALEPAVVRKLGTHFSLTVP